MKLRRFLVLLFLVLIVLAIPLFFLFTINQKIVDDDIIEVRTIPNNVNVSDVIGFNLDTDALNFGVIYSGSRSRRNITIAGDFNNPVYVSFDYVGNTSEWISSSKNGFILYPGSIEQIEFVIEAPLNTTLGYYDGMINVFFRKLNYVGDES